MTRTVALLTTIVITVGTSSCGGDDPTPALASTPADTSAIAGDDREGLFPDVVDAAATPADDGTWTFEVTILSPYDTPQRYADAWRVLAPDETELGIRLLLHDHADEQPFTRSLTGVVIPTGITEVTIEARDQFNGWGGQTLTISLD
jgi:hypothetical protein